jgi:hypothetical protein
LSIEELEQKYYWRECIVPLALPLPGIIEVRDGAWISNNLTMATHTQRTIKKRQRQNNQNQYQRKNLN